MTDNEFNLSLLADPFPTRDGRERVRYVLTRALCERAKEVGAAGCPDRAARLRWVVRQIEQGRAPTKRAAGKCRADIAIVRKRLVDGFSLSGL